MFRRCCVPEQPDAVAVYASSLGCAIRSKVLLLEGTTDVDLFHAAARLELAATGKKLVGDDLCLIAAGEGDLGGTRGVIRELMCFRGLSRACLLPTGRPRYRVVALFDNDKAGRLAVRAARDWDASLLEFKDLFRLWPMMPLTSNLDPISMNKIFEKENEPYKNLEWELEDLLPDPFLECFLEEVPNAVARSTTVNGKTHRDFTRDGKAQLHRFVKQHAMREDLLPVAEALKALRCYLWLK
jgi:hypothetical protein